MDNNDSGLGQQLIEQGWLQGTLFKVPATLVFCNHVIVSKDAVLTTQRIEKELDETHRLVLISQECDIVSNSEPYVEALLCYEEEDKNKRDSWERNSARYFVVDPRQNLVAQGYSRVIFSKESLQHLELTEWPGSKERLNRFITWLTRRYNRPALDDELVRTFQHPVTNALQKHFKQNKPVADTFTHAVHEIRINLPTTNTAPYDLRLVLIVKDEELSNAEVSAIEATLQVIQQAVDPSQIAFEEPLIANETDISVAEYRQAIPIYLEYFTFKGENVSGVPPTTLS